MSNASSEPDSELWWVIRNGRTHGPVSWARLKSLCHAGKIAPNDLLRRNGETPLPADQFAGELFPERDELAEARDVLPAEPTSEHDTGSESQERVAERRLSHAPTTLRAALEGVDRKRIRAYVGTSSSLATLFVTRILQSDFGVIRPTEEEKLRLIQSRIPLTEELAQAYAAWRRSVLSIACVFLAFNAALGIGNLTTSLDGRFNAWNFLVIGFVSMGLFGLQVLGAFLTGWAALRWDDIQLSRRLARASWIVVFLLPIALLAVPISKLVTLGGGWVANIVVMKLVAERAVVLFPKVLGLFPGVIRACMTLKTLVPESSAPGWTAIVIAPAYSLFFFVSVAVALQLTLSPALISGLVLLGTAPLIYVWRARELMRSHTESDGRRLVRSLRRTSGSCTGIGLGLILLQLMSWVDLGEISWRMLISSVAGLIGSLLLFTVVSSDLLLALLRQSFEESQAFQGSAQQRQLEQKFMALTRVGLTEIAAGEAELVRQVRDTVGQAAKRGKDWAKKSHHEQPVTDDQESPTDSATEG